MQKLHVYLTILLYFVVKDTYCLHICGRYDPEVATKVNLKLFMGNSSLPIIFGTLLANPEAIKPKLDPNKETVIYIHGFVEAEQFDNVLVVIKAYLDRGDVNIILIDWGAIALNLNYFEVSSKVCSVGKATAEALMKLADTIDLTKLYVVGHSLGSHVAAHIGRNIHPSLKGLTGLDPALPGFYPGYSHIKETDAQIVIILHTSFGLGTHFSTGTVDFYVNTAIYQPGCFQIDTVICSHQRSTKIFAEALRNPKAFPARRCPFGPLIPFREDEEMYYGTHVPKHIRGKYCFTTNAQSPYGKGS